MKKKYIYAALCAALFLILIAAVITVDVAPIGPQESLVGLSSINKAVHDFTGVNMVWYDITQWLGAAAIVLAAVFAFIGLVQLVKRKSLIKVDRQILFLGILYAVTIAAYIFFNLVAVNYRPVIMPGEQSPEASFPSSHTMLICVVMGSSAMLFGYYLRGRRTGRVLQIFCAAVMVLTVAGRLVSGVHWCTDIVGGLLLSAALLFLYAGANDF